jgi:hypothetical protein
MLYWFAWLFHVTLAGSDESYVIANVAFEASNAPVTSSVSGVKWSGASMMLSCPGAPALKPSAQSMTPSASASPLLTTVTQA